MNSDTKTIILCITGGIAAFKALELIKNLRKDGYATIVIMTKSATQMIDPKEFKKVSGNDVYSDLFEENFDYKTVLAKRQVDHIQVADAAALFVILPATANIIAKIAHGIADDFLTTSILATKAPVLFCPSMNVNMWTNPIVQENLTKIKRQGYYVIDPDSGALACGYEGKGRLADLKKITEEIHDQMRKTEELKGKRIIITAGGTIEPIDDIRFITNRSSGKMGAALAEACYQRGADVLLLQAKHAVSPRFPIIQHTFETADELEALIRTYCPHYDICFHAAAISDYSLASQQKGKLSSSHKLSLDLVPREKTLTVIKRANPSLKLIAFKAEWDVHEKEFSIIASKKIKQFNLDAILANDMSKKNHGFEVDTNEVFIFLKNGEKKKFPLTTKRELAGQIIDYFTRKKLL
ncbi:MAG: bifunctional phosphopantothenoylcysteine decarboxylase/phosphopantothenate--cysteine ligase CoaBC [Candidatus Levyibacteriota bacterium]